MNKPKRKKIPQKNYANYMRVIAISYELFAEWLNLPQEFLITNVGDDPSRAIILLQIACPHKKEFQVDEGQQIPIATPMAHANRYGFLVKLWHPDLGQKEPKDRIRRTKIGPHKDENN